MHVRRILLSLALLLPAFAVAFVGASTPASAEPHFTFYSCHNSDGHNTSITRLDQCVYGTIVVYDSYTDKIQAQIDGWCAKLQAIDGASQSQIVSRCINKHKALTTAQLLGLAKIAITCYATKKPSCLLPVLKL